MVEVLVVVAIMTLLFSLVVVAAGTIREKMHNDTTRAIILKIVDRLEEYKSLTGSYPPDGYDFEVKSDGGKGIPIWGAACLYEFLSKEFESVSKVGGQVRHARHQALLSFTDSELSGEDPDFPGIRELVDGYGLPLHYDNTENGEFHPEKQGEVSHMVPLDFHPPDPRTSDDKEIVPRVGIQRPGAYDMWSHGSTKAHEDPDVPLEKTIGTWNVEVEKKGPVQEGKP